MTDVSLDRGTRNSLLALQRTSSRIGTTQDRLSTGQAVNSALDDALAFFKSRSLSDRASDLSTVKNGIHDAIQTVNSALDGLETLEKTLKQMKALAAAAKTESDSARRGTMAEQYDALRAQLTDIARDASFNGVNLIGATPDDLTVKANAGTGTDEHTISVTGKAMGAEGLGLSAANGGESVSVTARGYNDDPDQTKIVDDWYDGKGEYELDTISNLPTTGYASHLSMLTSFNGGSDGEISWSDIESADKDNSRDWVLSFNDKGWHFWDLDSNGAIDGMEVFEDGDVFDGTYPAYNVSFNFTKSGGWAAESGYGAAVEADLAEIESALSSVRSTAQSLGTSSSSLQIRLDHTSEMMSLLTSGSAQLVAADMGEEGANMLSLQTRQQLGVISLSIAQSSQQSVLSLF